TSSMRLSTSRADFESSTMSALFLTVPPGRRPGGPIPPLPRLDYVTAGHAVAGPAPAAPPRGQPRARGHKTGHFGRFHRWPRAGDRPMVKALLSPGDCG